MITIVVPQATRNQTYNTSAYSCLIPFKFFVLILVLILVPYSPTFLILKSAVIHKYCIDLIQKSLIEYIYIY